MNKAEALEIKKTIVKNLSTRDIYMFGCTNASIDFYKKYKDTFNFIGYVSEGGSLMKSEQERVAETGLKVYAWGSVVNNRNAYYVLFGTAFGRYDLMLSTEGLRWAEDFCGFDSVNLAITDKQIVLLAGHCQIELMLNFLREIPEVNEKYFFHFLATNKLRSRWDTRINNFIRNLADVYAYLYIAPEARAEDRLIILSNRDYLFFSEDEICSDCKILRIPNLSSIRLYWPSMVDERLNPYYEYFRGSQHFMNRRHAPINFTDALIKNMLDEGYETDYIVSNINDSISVEQVKKHLDNMLAIIDHLDDGCDMKIGDFIREHYADEMLFKDADHCQPVLLKEFLKRFLAMLDIDTEALEDCIEEIFLPDSIALMSVEEHCSTVPVYPVVAKAMGLKWCDETTKYPMLLYTGTENLDYKEYVRKYCQISKTIYELQKIW